MKKKSSGSKYKDNSIDFSLSTSINDGIPEYNALLDKNLGSRRAFLLKSKRQLKHLKQTGCLSYSKNGSRTDNWDIQIKKYSDFSNLEPPRPVSEKKTPLTSSIAVPRPASERKAKRPIPSSTTRVPLPSNSERPVTSSAITTTESKAKSVRFNMPSSKPTAKRRSQDTSSTVDKLMRMDCTIQMKIEETKERITDLQNAKKKIDKRIATLRKSVRGVNAVKENDIAVAHASSIMQQRLVKAEEDYMKAVTHRSNLKNRVDDIRREIISIDKVRSKLDSEIKNANDQLKILRMKTDKNLNAWKMVMSKINDMERQAEEDRVERQMSIPSIDNTSSVIDVPKLMASMSERAITRRKTVYGTKKQNLDYKFMEAQHSVESNLKKDQAGKIHSNVSKYKNAFQLIQQELGFDDIETYTREFVTTETDLLSQYKHSIQLQQEREKLEVKRNQAKTEWDNTTDSDTKEFVQSLQDLETQIKDTLQKTEETRQLHDLRKVEHDRLYQLLLRFLDAIKDTKKPMQPQNTSSIAVGLVDLLGLVQDRVEVISVSTHYYSNNAPMTESTRNLLSHEQAVRLDRFQYIISI